MVYMRFLLTPFKLLESTRLSELTSILLVSIRSIFSLGQTSKFFNFNNWTTNHTNCLFLIQFILCFNIWYSKKFLNFPLIYCTNHGDEKHNLLWRKLTKSVSDSFSWNYKQEYDVLCWHLASQEMYTYVSILIWIIEKTNMAL